MVCGESYPKVKKFTLVEYSYAVVDWCLFKEDNWDDLPCGG